VKIFIDSADITEIRDAAQMGLIDGVTTNPSLVAKVGRTLEEVVKDICEVVDGPISAEVLATDTEGILREGRVLAKMHPNVVVKVPLIADGIRAVRTFTEEGIKTNVTLCFSAPQALLAAKAGATFISPFIGRLDDTGINGMELIGEIRTIYDNYGFQTEILAASIRTVNHVKVAALIGADVATVPPATLKALVKHPLTDKGLEGFLADWAKTGQKIV
jgi:transaldolase